MIMSPSFIPARSAGSPGITPFIMTPFSMLRFRAFSSLPAGLQGLLHQENLFSQNLF